MELSPGTAAEAARATYETRFSKNLYAAAGSMGAFGQSFDIANGTMIRGVSGMGPISSETGFGFIANGRNTRETELLIAIRGTESNHDWLTNIRLAGTRGPSGHTVHRGFWMLAQGILEQVNRALDSYSPTSVHVTGHSLGGATATLVADAIRLSSGRQNVKLYTFGAPRAGVELHTRHLTSSLGSQNIFRAYHHTDPVPMVPVFPYSHVPHEDKAYLMNGPGMLISLAAHDMANYKTSVGAGGWSGVPIMRDTGFDSMEQAAGWLDSAGSLSGSMLSGRILRMIMSALSWILRKVGHLTGYAILGGSTIVDYIARLLYSGVLVNVEISYLIGRLMAAALSFVGRTAVAGANMTVAFFRYVLDLLFRMVSTMASRAIDRTF
jgi:triacylglycerol lipase